MLDGLMIHAKICIWKMYRCVSYGYGFFKYQLPGLKPIAVTQACSDSHNPRAMATTFIQKLESTWDRDLFGMTPEKVHKQ